MVKKDKKQKEADKKARNAQKTAKKSAKSESKKKQKSSRANDDHSDDDNVDLDAVLAEYARQQEQFLKVTETVCAEAPAARSSATLVASPANAHELFLFGGEHYNGALARFFNELYVYHIARDEWRLVRSANTPLPRSGHAWTRGGNTGGVYLFGGEFSSPKQGTFYHYNDFWRLEPATREWTKLESPKNKGPTARSGHRMTYWKQYIILFGGFQDTSSTTRYLADLHLYDTANFVWHAPVLPPASPKPDARSSFTFLPHEQGAVLFGGYSRVKSAALSGGQGGKGQHKGGGGGGAQRDVLKPFVHSDAWYLRITPPPEGNPSGPPTVRWERRKKPVNSPQPARAGATMAHHRGRGIQFGGVHDVEESEEGMESEFFNTLGVWNIERNRYFPLALRRPRQAKRIAATADGAKNSSTGGAAGKGGRGKKDEEELLANLRALELKAAEAKGEDTTALLEAEAAADEANGGDEESDEKKVEKPVLWEMPHPRFNAQLTVQDDVLYIFGGTFEKDDREFTFCDLYAVDLGKLDGVRQLFRREVDDWIGEESSSDDDDEDEEDEDEDEDGQDDQEEAEDDNADRDERSTRRKSKKLAELQAEDELAASPAPSLTFSDDTATDAGDATEAEQKAADQDDGTPQPRPFETLRDFFQRTGNAWQELVLDELARRPRSQLDDERQSIKGLRKAAFERAEARWWDCREEMQALEDEQEEAGIGEVVNLADKANAGGAAAGGVGRRR